MREEDSMKWEGNEVEERVFSSSQAEEATAVFSYSAFRTQQRESETELYLR